VASLHLTIPHRISNFDRDGTNCAGPESGFVISEHIYDLSGGKRFRVGEETAVSSVYFNRGLSRIWWPDAVDLAHLVRCETWSAAESDTVDSQ
jgi:hypothetical protein